MKQTILVIGASGAIGRAIVDVAAEVSGVRVAATYNAHVQSAGRNVHWIHFDVTSHSPHDASQLRGGIQGRLAAVVFCVGIPSTKKFVVDTSEGEWHRLITTNALGFVATYNCLKDLARESHSRVVVLSSDATRTVAPTNGAYTASKAALESIALTLAKEEAGFGVRVNIVAPSLVDSPLADHILALKGVTNRSEYCATLPWGRMLTREEVAATVVSLALDKKWGYLTGQTIRIAASM